jgi:hypothetical protein
MSADPGDGLYIVSMDHSPSEQLTGADWHTTVLLASMAYDQANLARVVAARLRPTTKALTKFSRAGRSYRRDFLPCFFDAAGKAPVYVFAISARERAIRHSVDHFINELDIRRFYRRDERPGRSALVTLGPFVQASNGAAVTVRLSERRAAMGLFIAHFVLRMQAAMWEAGNSMTPPIGLVNWNFYGDKFAGATGEDLDLMFSMLVQQDRGHGRLLWGYFLEGDTVDADLLTDNVAGALNALVTARSAMPEGHGKASFFYWEQWS